MVTHFLDVVLDGEARLLTRRGAVVHLTPKALDLLRTLVEARPRAVAKAELLERVWPSTFVTDASLARTVHEIREALGEGGAAAVRTVHGFGYAFTADAVDEIPAASAPAAAGVEAGTAAAWLLSSGRAIALPSGRVLIGRDPAAEVPIESLLASWHHAHLDIYPGGATLHDLGSKNGTTVGGVRVSSPTAVSDGDEIGIGGLRFVLRRGVKVAETETADA